MFVVVVLLPYHTERPTAILQQGGASFWLNQCNGFWTFQGNCSYTNFTRHC
jgi:hypothetical protein